jgi:hypothetical protein
MLLTGWNKMLLLLPEKKARNMSYIRGCRFACLPWLHPQLKQLGSNIDEVKYRVGAKVAVYVVKKSDISAISYPDGTKEFFCNGVPYSSATHYCDERFSEVYRK